VKNAFVAETFEELADLAELAGESAHKARAYRGFADTVRKLPEAIEAVCARGALRDLAGVGVSIEAKATELCQRGVLEELEELRSRVPTSLLDVTRVPGLGPKRVRALWQGIGITSLGELIYACRENRLLRLQGFGEKSQERTLAAATFLLEGAGQMPLSRAIETGGVVTSVLLEAGAYAAELAGEARRGVEVVTEIVVVASGIDVGEAHDALVAHHAVHRVTDLTEHGFRVALDGRVSVRVRVMSRDEMVAGLLVETGDAAHVRWLSERARDRGTTLADIARLSASEDGVYRALGIEPVPPELRDGAAPDVPKRLLVAGDLSGVFHVHTDWSDGTGSLVDMARAAVRAGHRFLGISDHSKAAAYARGLDRARLEEQRGAIDAARRELSGITILHGTECDILADGSLDLDDDTLARLDFVVASVHSSMQQDHETMTARLVRAVSHPLVTMLGHPTGRLLLARKGYSFDLPAVAAAAAKNETYLEINANPNRLDLSDAMVRRAAACGAEFVINPDAHEVAGMSDARFGVKVARRAGLSSTQVLNARECDAVLAKLEARKHRAKSAQSA
jgi:DNA polymerase (family 10)